MTKIEQFFARYEEGANSFDPDLVTSEFAAFLFDLGSGPRVLFYISYDDEQKVMQEAGLIPSDVDE